MNDETYKAMRSYIQVAVELEVKKAAAEFRVAPPTETRSEPLIEVREGPASKNGIDGKDGRDGVDGKDGTNGKRGEKGLDGRDGRDGKDGIASLDDLRGEVAKAVEATVGPTVQKQVAVAIAALPTLQYRGVFREGTTYKAGECVTWAGSMWHAGSETQEKPGAGETAWTMMVKKGDKGRDAT